MNTFFAQIDLGQIVSTELSVILSYSLVIIPAGLLIWGVTWGIGASKGMAESAADVKPRSTKIYRDDQGDARMVTRYSSSRGSLLRGEWDDDRISSHNSRPVKPLSDGRGNPNNID